MQRALNLISRFSLCCFLQLRCSSHGRKANWLI
ncbi:Uncharacterised protein [Vibrio cholerae]|nr:Uncharacterised protein [Vibrio cholerae]